MFKVGEKVLMCDEDNGQVHTILLTKDHGDGEFSCESEAFEVTISPCQHDGEMQHFIKLPEMAYNYILGLEKFALKNGYFKDEEN